MLSVADMMLLKLLREIMDVKYLETPLFARQVSVFKSLFFIPKNIMALFLGLILEYNAGALITDWR